MEPFTWNSIIVTIVGAMLSLGGGFILWFIRKTGTDMGTLRDTINKDVENLQSYPQ